MFVIFDLPTLTKEQKKTYSTFRDNILKDGFIMVQYSVYSRFCRNDTEYLKLLRRIKTYAPRDIGEVRVLRVTERQYNNMIIFSNSIKQDEKLLSTSPLVIIE